MNYNYDKIINIIVSKLACIWNRPLHRFWQVTYS